MAARVASPSSLVKTAPGRKKLERAAVETANATEARSDAAALVTAAEMVADARVEGKEVHWMKDWPCSTPRVMAAAEMAALSAGHWRCSAPGSRNCHPSAAASIAMLMAAISAANAAPSGIVPSPTPLAEKADTHNKPFSLSKRE